MNKYNLYRIRKDQEQAVIQKLESVGMTRIAEVEHEGYQISFYFPGQPDPVAIWWADTYAEFLAEVGTPLNQVYHAALLLSSETACYAVSLGKTHFYLRPFCDSDFGLNLAERIADPADVRMKNSKFHQSRRSKAITTYQRGSEVDYDSGESFQYVKARTVEERLWGKVASFGTSVEFHIPDGWRGLPALVDRVEQTLQEPVQLPLPRVQRVTDPQRAAELDRRLVDAILARSQLVDVGGFTVSGVEFVFPDNCNYSLRLKGQRRVQGTAGELTIDTLTQFVRDGGVDLHQELDNVLVHVHNEYGRDHSEPLKNFLDYVDDDDNCCLIDGCWYVFNQSYVDYLHTEVDKIDFVYSADFDIPDTMDEPAFIAERVANDEYLQLHRDLVPVGQYRVEMADLYKDGTLHCVKVGEPQKLVYAVEQACAAIKALASGAPIEVDGQGLDVVIICLWLVLDRVTTLRRLSDIRSLILHMRLAEWRRIALNAGLRPLVKVNYRRPQ